METSIFTRSVSRKLSSALTFTILHTWSKNFHFAYGFHFFIFLFYCKPLTSVLLYLFYLQSSKTTPEGRQAPAQKTQHSPISHNESRNSLNNPGACSLGDSLTFSRSSTTGGERADMVPFLSLVPLSQCSPCPILAQHTHRAEGSKTEGKIQVSQ